MNAAVYFLIYLPLSNLMRQRGGEGLGFRHKPDAQAKQSAGGRISFACASGLSGRPVLRPDRSARTAAGEPVSSADMRASMKLCADFCAPRDLRHGRAAEATSIQVFTEQAVVLSRAKKVGPRD
jgi:hypothetical protein